MMAKGAQTDAKSSNSRKPYSKMEMQKVQLVLGETVLGVGCKLVDGTGGVSIGGSDCGIFSQPQCFEEGT
jgi:hypothetical protein